MGKTLLFVIVERNKERLQILVLSLMAVENLIKANFFCRISYHGT